MLAIHKKILRYASIYHAQVKLAVSGTGAKGAGLPDSFWVQFVQMCQRLHADPYGIAAVVQHESGFDPGARNIQNKVTIAQGLNQLIQSTAAGMGIKGDLWKNFYKLPPEESLKWTEKFFQRFPLQGKDAGDIYVMNFGGFNNPDGSMYASLEAQQEYQSTHPEAVFKNPKYQELAIQQNKGFSENGKIMPAKVKASVRNGPPGGIKAKIDAARATIGNSSPPPFEDPNPNWTGPTELTISEPAPVVTTSPKAPAPAAINPTSGEENTFEGMLWS